MPPKTPMSRNVRKNRIDQRQAPIDLDDRLHQERLRPPLAGFAHVVRLPSSAYSPACSLSCSSEHSALCDRHPCCGDRRGADRVSAGRTMIQADDPEGWRSMVAASQLVRDKADVIGRCAEAARTAGEDQRCTITVKAPAQ